jgi:hypothetical protein
MLTILVAVALGLLIGELVAGIPLSRRIACYERRKPTPFPGVGDLGESIIAEWPDDRAAAMLEAWRTERAIRRLRAMHQAAAADSARAPQAVSMRSDPYRTGVNWQRSSTQRGSAQRADSRFRSLGPHSVPTLDNASAGRR